MMNWNKANNDELCTVILYDPMATEEDKNAAGRELFNRIRTKKSEAMKMSKYGKYESKLNESWASWEPYLIKDATVLDYRFMSAMDCAVADRVPRQIVIEFYTEMFLELIEYVARHRETYEQQARRQLGAARRHEKERLAYIGRPTSKNVSTRLVEGDREWND